MTRFLKRLVPISLIVLYTPFAFADASYQSSMQITGGSFIDTLKSNPFSARLAKNLLAPTNTLTLVHGNQKAVVTKEYTEIWDIDKETITRIDTEKKTYSVTTFDDMRKMFQQMPENIKKMQDQMKQAQDQMKQQQDQMPKSDLKTSFDVKVNNTGVTKVVNGVSCQEQIVTMTVTITDPNAPPPPPPAPGDPPTPTAIHYTMTNDIWIAPDPPQIKEVHDFDTRMAQKMMQGVDATALITQMKQQTTYANPQFAGLFGNQPGAADALAQMGKEMAKVKGTHIMEIMSMGGNATAPAGSPGTPGAPPATPPSSGGSVVGQVAGDTATQTAQGESGRLGVVGSALSNSVIGAFHRKKATPPPAATPAPTTPAAGASASGTQTVAVTMMQMTTQESNFSNESVPTNVFTIPAGFKKVPNPYEQMAAQMKGK